MASCSSDTGNLRKDEEEEEEGRLKVMSNNPDYELLSYSACIPSEPLQEETPIGEYKYHAVEDHDNRAAALQRVLLERRALSRDMVRLQDSLMAKTQENLLLRGKLGISELELDRKEDIIRECNPVIIIITYRLHADNNRLLCVVQANGLDIGGGGGGNKHHRSMVSSPATTTASIESECVIPQSKPMSAEEEYFRMVVLAVKLNSTYLDNLGLFDPKDLYGRACEEKVPFHQWHRWVESQMIRGVYRPLAGSAPGVDSEEVGRKSTQDDDHLQQAGYNRDCTEWWQWLLW
ncbi:hypothetical protein Pmar_PMAR011726 [Perkinsus marinus ATCC 50983]|uniref:Uncharacterized protein n=1 Tax=Perkinsus marinus (strain ATCC 50983 / TXsc) TaxID=423536 RepID=C5LCJ7_PERM5|nr:hypothetical protein Pmar_PMAR011726 [Perkinsus marinus ATCC 50983]EER05680.1 hypothetical protein Pmar_PMAR011726 [Perkinsus marinus ATCC 50983]|eukprot:XP_002773864.1 hypothetical protein Pmar_PMAR011726 [Perkinsus marinus ATCC 50983]